MYYYSGVRGGQIMGQIWWLTSVIPAIRKLKREESHEFQASLNYNETLSQTNKQTNNNCMAYYGP